MGHDHELVTADARHEVSRTHALLQSPSDDAQHGIARLVTPQVVDRLEAVEVDEEHGEAVAEIEARLEHLHEVRAVGEARERVVMGEVLELVTHVIELAHVMGRGDDAGDDRVVEHAGELEPQRSAGGRIAREGQSHLERHAALDYAHVVGTEGADFVGQHGFHPGEGFGDV